MSPSRRQPMVSVIVPTHNRAPVLSETLPQLLDQSYPEYELIVVADGCTDETPMILDDFARAAAAPMQVVTGTYGAPGLARNAGVECASGSWLVFTDDDCMVTPNWLTDLMVRATQLRGKAALCGGFQPFLMETPAERYQHYRMTMLFGGQRKEVRAAPMMNFAVSRSDFDAAGGFPAERLPALEDWELCRRLREQRVAITYDPDVWVTHRYQREWEPVIRRLDDTAALAVGLCRSRAERGGLILRSVLKAWAAPLWTLRVFPLDLYPMAVRLEFRMLGRRLSAWWRSGSPRGAQEDAV